MHFFFHFHLLPFLLINLANKITNGNPLKAKQDIFIEKAGATGVKVFGRGATSVKVFGRGGHGS